MEIRMDATIELIEIELFLENEYFPPFIVGPKISQNPWDPLPGVTGVSWDPDTLVEAVEDDPVMCEKLIVWQIAASSSD